jgi:FkbM family methyltransferase
MLNPHEIASAAERKVKRFLSRKDLRSHPARGLYRRMAWRLRWQVVKDPWLVWSEDGLPLLLPRSGAGALIYFQGASEPELSGFLKQYLKQGMVFADVGAHLGEYTILAASLVGNSGRVHAFEACPDTFEILGANIRLNLTENVTAYPWAVWKENGLTEFEKSPEPSTSALRPGHNSLQGGSLVQVRAISLDAHFGQIESRKPGLIKIDVEGAELQVLEGAKGLLSSPTAPDLVIEYGPRNTMRYGYSAEEVCHFLRNLGYSLYEWRDGEALAPVMDLPHRAETQDSCNLVATKIPSHVENLLPETTLGFASASA